MAAATRNTALSGASAQRVRSPIAFGFATVVVLGTMLAFWLSRTYDTTLATAIAGARSAAQTYAANVERLIDSVDENNRFVLAWNRLGIGSAQFDAMLRAQKATAPHYMDILLLDRDGRIVQWSGTGPVPTVRDRPYYRALADAPARDTHIDEPRPSRVNIGRWFFSHSRAERSPDGKLEHVAVAILEGTLFDDSLRRLAERMAVNAVLVHDSGMLIASSRNPAVHGQAAPAAIVNSARNQETVNSNSLIWTERVGRTPLSVAIEIDRRDALAPWRERATVGAMLYLVGTLVILALSVSQARHARALADTESRYRALTEQSLVGIFLLRDDDLLYVNPRLAEIFAADPARLTTRRTLLERITTADRERCVLQFAQWQHDADARGSLSFSATRTDGGTIDLEAQGRQVTIDSQPAALVMISDVSEQASAQRTLHQMAYHDTLTGLANRALLFDRLTQVLARSQRTGGRFALMLIDLDGFKEINDTYGHDAGDLVLRTIADRLLSTLRESDAVARIGGDEFLVVLETTPGTVDAEGVARKLLGELARPIELATPPDDGTSGTIAVSGSIGIAFFPDHGEDSDSLIAAADEAMYAAKRAGKNTCSVGKSHDREFATTRRSLLEWSPEYALGVATIDEQHEKLFSLCNDLALKFGDRDNVEGRQAALNALTEFAALHFRTEEGMMAASGFIGAEGHIRQHRDLERKLATLEHLLTEHGPSMALKTLRDWLLLHVSTSDRQFAAHLRERSSTLAHDARSVA